ncbi:MAG TPA: hypothetical protein VKT80_14415 [Chloroflexota bacterium]|nr:hypothetical protein [Chloroflexota bacterium]
MRKAALDQVGSFDEAYFVYVEAMDLSWRLWKAGWEVWYALRAAISHEGAGAPRT